MSKDFELGERVSFIRMQSNGEPIKGEGVIVAKLIGVSKRINYSVKETQNTNDGVAIDKAWNLEAEALNGDEESDKAYIDHHNAITAVVDQYNVDQKALADAANAKIDLMHDEFFGPRMDV